MNKYKVNLSGPELELFLYQKIKELEKSNASLSTALDNCEDQLTLEK